jgi:hypothetical protein
MTRTSTRDRSTIGLDDPAPAGSLVELPDEPDEVVCRCLLERDHAMLELGVSVRREHTVYVVAVEHCTQLSPAEARAAAGHLLRAADEAELRDHHLAAPGDRPGTPETT